MSRYTRVATENTACNTIFSCHKCPPNLSGEQVRLDNNNNLRPISKVITKYITVVTFLTLAFQPVFKFTIHQRQQHAKAGLYALSQTSLTRLQNRELYFHRNKTNQQQRVLSLYL